MCHFSQVGDCGPQLDAVQGQLLGAQPTDNKVTIYRTREQKEVVVSLLSLQGVKLQTIYVPFLKGSGL